MSVAELKQAVDALSADDRLELAAYLRWQTRKEDPEWREELGRRLEKCKAGHGHSSEELQQLHDKLPDQDQ